jgi:hypothetical protein
LHYLHFWLAVHLVNDQILEEILAPLHELELHRGLRPDSSRVVGNGCEVSVLLALFSTKDREELRDGLDLWEMLVDFSILEEIIEDDQELPQVDALLVFVALFWVFVGELVHQILQMKLVVGDQLVHITGRDLVGALRMRLCYSLLLEDDLFDEG